MLTLPKNILEGKHSSEIRLVSPCSCWLEVYVCVFPSVPFPAVLFFFFPNLSPSKKNLGHFFYSLFFAPQPPWPPSSPSPCLQQSQHQLLRAPAWLSSRLTHRQVNWKIHGSPKLASVLVRVGLHPQAVEAMPCCSAGSQAARVTQWPSLSLEHTLLPVYTHLAKEHLNRHGARYVSGFCIPTEA